LGHSVHAQVEGCESLVGKCDMDEGSLSCGPFQIKYPYWEDCGKPGAGKYILFSASYTML